MLWVYSYPQVTIIPILSVFAQRRNSLLHFFWSSKRQAALSAFDEQLHYFYTMQCVNIYSLIWSRHFELFEFKVTSSSNFPPFHLPLYLRKKSILCFLEENNWELLQKRKQHFMFHINGILLEIWDFFDKQNCLFRFISLGVLCRKARRSLWSFYFNGLYIRQKYWRHIFVAFPFSRAQKMLNKCSYCSSSRLSCLSRDDSRW